MQRIYGNYQPGEPDIFQADASVPLLPNSQNFWKIDEFEIPITTGGLSLVYSKKGKVILFTGWNQEIPLYYSVDHGKIYWHEQALALPNKAILVERGQAVVWDGDKFSFHDDIDPIPRPSIQENFNLETVIDEYLNLLVQAVRRRIENCEHPIAVSQSGGLDSCLIAWALHKLKVKFTPLVACTSLQDWDFQQAFEVLTTTFGVEPIPILITKEDLPGLFEQAVFCYESCQQDNLKMAAANIAIARKCQELGIKTIFNGHGHDDLMGTYGLTQGTYKKLTQGSESERWRDARRETISGFGMEKMFSTTFRRFGISVQMPYYDRDLANWVLSRSKKIIPVKAKKPFARLVARTAMPHCGEWNNTNYNSKGYITGAGLYESVVFSAIEQELEKAKTRLSYLKNIHWTKVAAMHNN